MRIASLVASSIGMLGVCSVAAGADDADILEPDTLEQVVVTGTRVANRSALDAAAPVDVVSAEQMQRLGITEVNQALALALPSYNYPRVGLADGSDAVRPATLRGLSPDQTLVLINSKRRHSAALVNVNGTVGRGAAAVDLNTVPTAMVQSVEVLRDGASAQYGSDAIAGVINLRLREAREGGAADVSYGAYESSYDVITGAPDGRFPDSLPAAQRPVPTWSAPGELSRDVSDGETLTASVWKGLPLSDSGFLTFAAEYKDQQRTERGGWDRRRQYALLPGNVFDPREQTFNRYNSWYGEPELEQVTVFSNAGYDVSDAVQLYGWVSAQKRDTRGAGFYRLADDIRNVPEIYPDGFLPIVAAAVSDYSAAFGTRWALGDWNMDTSLVYGRNKMEFHIENTLNRSLGPDSPRQFDAGGFDHDQLVLNMSAVRPVAVSAFASPLNVAVGIEARRESYSIFAGEPDSWRNGGVQLNGLPTASGAQVFPGFRPENVVDEARTAVGAFLDLEANVTQQLLASLAVRGESYSDFGQNISGKLSLRYDFSDSFALRGSMQNGFRAPSLQQQHFQTTSTNFVDGVPFEITTVPASHPVAQALGAEELDAEESVNISIGAVLQLGELDITLDAYRIDIDDRIVLSENLTQDAVRDFLVSRGFEGIGGARFFINGVDTRTEGVDLVIRYPLKTASVGRFDLVLAGNVNSTDVTRVLQTAQVAAINPAPRVFDRINILTLEEGTPKDKYSAAVNWSLQRLGASLRATRYGDVLFPGTVAENDLVLTARTLLDMEVRFDFTESVRASIGADNVLDEYPNELPPKLNVTGTQSFSNYSPFGRSGRFVFGKLSYRF